MASAVRACFNKTAYPPLYPLRGGEHTKGYRETIILLDTVFPEGYNWRVSYELKQKLLGEDQNTPHFNPLPYTTTASRPTWLPPRGEAGGGIAEENRDRMSLLRDGKVPPMCFCETNPPILSWKTAVIHLLHNGLHKNILPENGGFVLENEPTGPPSRELRRDSSDSEGGFWGVERRKLRGLGYRFMPLIPKLTPMHLAINVTRHAQC